MSSRKNLVDMVKAAANRGPETTPQIKKDRAAFRQKVAAKVKEAADLVKGTRQAPDAGKSAQRAAITNEFREAGNVAIEKMLPAYLRSLLELDTIEPYIVETAQLEQWFTTAKKRCERKDKELAFKGQPVPRCQTNVRNLAFFLKLRTGRNYGTLPPGVEAKPKVGFYAKTPETPAKGAAKGYGVLPEVRTPQRTQRYDKVAPNPYGRIDPRYQNPLYGDVPGEPASKSKGALLQEQLAASKSSAESRSRVFAMAARAGLDLTAVSTTASLNVAKINVERGRVLLDTLEQVKVVVKSMLGATRVVDVMELRPFLAITQPYALVAARAFSAGEPIAHYDGELVSSESARHLEVDGVGETLRTLRAGMWAVRGYSDPDEVPRSGGLGSFAADNLDLCASTQQERECRLADTKLNARLVTITHSLNALASESDYRPEESFLVLVAEHDIGVGDLVFYRHMSLAEYLGGADDRA